jgi:endonuclease-3 related protein
MSDATDDAPALRAVLADLERTYGAEHWHWMPDAVSGPQDIVAGAVLVQHTTWTNAERALESLRAAGALDLGVLAGMPEEEIAPLVRVSGTPSVKARRLKALALAVEATGGLASFLALSPGDLRARLLATHGIGPETADAIALYAARHRVFVIDAYTRRLFRRLGIGPRDGDSYEDWRSWFEDTLPDAGAARFQRYHAWIVLHGKALCRATPRCAPCPLLARCPAGRALVAGRGYSTHAEPPGYSSASSDAGCISMLNPGAAGGR